MVGLHLTIFSYLNANLAWQTSYQLHPMFEFVFIKDVKILQDYLAQL